MAAVTADAFAAQYGAAWTLGILTDHVAKVEAAGLTVATVDGLAVVVDADGAIPVVCSELIEVSTEDGPISGRCGLPVKAGAFACEGHGADIAAWAAQSEAETIAWERAR